MLGRVLAGRFTVMSRLGEGAMGTVYRAKQAPIGREVAVKILRSERALDETSRARFLREARANSLLTSPNTVTVFDFGASDGGDFYLAMELLEGESLGQRLKRIGRLDAAAAVDTARQALRSLAEAHAKGIIHRDLKPDNLFFARVRTNETYEEIVKVLDFGIAKMLRADDELSMNVVETQAGTVFGTPRYMSPEQAQGRPLDARSDLYSLGVMLYQMLTGRPPFTDDDAIVVMARHIKTTPKPMSEVAPDANIPPEVEAAVMRVLAKEASQRPQSAEAMSAELARACECAQSVISGVRASLAERREIRSDRPESKGAVTVANTTFDEGLGPVRRRVWPAVLGLVLAGAAIGGAVFVRNHRALTPAVAAVPAAAMAAPPLVDALQTAPGQTPPGQTPPAEAPQADPVGAPPVVSAAPAQAIVQLVPAPPPKAIEVRPAPLSPRAPAAGASNAAASTEARPALPARRHGPAPRPAGSSPPAPSSSVGYGYLE